MAASFNSCTLVGNLTRDVDMRFVGAKNTACASFGLAVNEKYGEKEEVLFIDVTLWGRTAEVANEYLSKGSQCLIDGKLKLDQWDDKKTGEKRSKICVTGNRLVLLGQKSETKSNRDAYSEPDTDDDWGNS